MSGASKHRCELEPWGITSRWCTGIKPRLNWQLWFHEIDVSIGDSLVLNWWQAIALTRTFHNNCVYQWLPMPQLLLSPGHPNVKMSCYQYRDSHYKDKMVSWPSYLYNGNPIPGRIFFILRWWPGYHYPWYIPYCINGSLSSMIKDSKYLQHISADKLHKHKYDFHVFSLENFHPSRVKQPSFWWLFACSDNSHLMAGCLATDINKFLQTAPIIFSKCLKLLSLMLLESFLKIHHCLFRSFQYIVHITLSIMMGFGAIYDVIFM